MDLQKLLDFLRRYFIPLSLGAAFAASVTWPFAANHYKELYEERIRALGARYEYLDQKYKDCIASAGSLPLPNLAPTRSATSQVPPVQNVRPTTPGNYPAVSNPDRPSKSEVRELARFYKLFTEWRINPQLRFEEGDVSHWAEQGYSERRLRIKFEARRQILERAEISGERLGDQGDLSNRAKSVEAALDAK
jgi:hypothetical protein